MHFASPYLLALLAALPIIILLQGWRARRPRSGLIFASLAPLRGLKPGWRVRLWWFPMALRLLVVALVVIAVARPQQPLGSIEAEAEGIDIVLALDISGSMTDGTREGQTKLDLVKAAATRFIEGRKNDRIGLVVFQRESLALSPLTLDYTALLQLLNRVENGLLEEGTAIGLGVAESLNLLRQSYAQSRTVILLTDGENNEPTVSPMQAARMCRALNVRLYTIGFLSDMGPSNISSPFEKELREMADTTGGRYYSADDRETLTNIYQEIARLEKSRVTRTGFSSFQELAPYFLMSAFGLLVIEVALRGTLFRRIP